MSTLVTGGTGFLGRHLVRKLLDRGEDVRVLTRSFDRELAELGADISEGSLLEPADVRRATDGVDRVYHLAGRVARRDDRAHEMYELHVDGTRRLLDALVDRDVEKVVVASTSGTVGVSNEPNVVATEDSPTREDLVKDWPYYLSKIYSERVCAKFRDDYDLPVVVMRPTLLLGPGDRRESSTGDVVRFLQGSIPAVPSGGLSFVDVRDTADAFIAAMQEGTPGESYLLGQVNLSVDEFFDRLEAISGVSRPKLELPDSLMVKGAELWHSASSAMGFDSGIDPTSAEMGQYYWYIDSSKARRELDWRPRDPDETLNDTVRWIREHHPEFREEGVQRNAPPDVPESTER